MMKQMMPGMNYPVSLPIVSGEVLSMGEYGNPIFFGNNRFTPKQIKIIPGKPTVPTIYVESEDKYYPGEGFPAIYNRILTSGVGGVVIPPDTSYIRVKIAVDRIANNNDPSRRCSLERENFQLVYPGYYPISGISDQNTPPLWPCDKENYSVWMNFSSLSWILS